MGFQVINLAEYPHYHDQHPGTGIDSSNHKIRSKNCTVPAWPQCHSKYPGKDGVYKDCQGDDDDR